MMSRGEFFKLSYVSLVLLIILSHSGEYCEGAGVCKCKRAEENFINYYRDRPFTTWEWMRNKEPHERVEYCSSKMGQEVPYGSAELVSAQVEFRFFPDAPLVSLEALRCEVYMGGWGTIVTYFAPGPLVPLGIYALVKNEYSGNLRLDTDIDCGARFINCM